MIRTMACFILTVSGAVTLSLLLTGILVVSVGGGQAPSVRFEAPRPPAKPETLTCVRVKEVTPAGTINYLCEVRK